MYMAVMRTLRRNKPFPVKQLKSVIAVKPLGQAKSTSPAFLSGYTIPPKSWVNKKIRCVINSCECVPCSIAMHPQNRPCGELQSAETWGKKATVMTSRQRRNETKNFPSLVRLPVCCDSKKMGFTCCRIRESLTEKNFFPRESGCECDFCWLAPNISKVKNPFYCNKKYLFITLFCLAAR